jgi:4-amino-4-deoxy-L-arabinose transferase-like glycosyltransferase
LIAGIGGRIFGLNLLIIGHMARRYLFFTLLLAILLFYLNIGGLTVYILDEAKNAACAKEMYFRGDLVKPTFNGNLRGDKPPLHYFFMMTSYSVFGVTEFAARFFSAFMGVVVYIASILFVRRYVGSKIAVWTGLALMSTFLFMLEFHLSVPDPYLIAFFLIGNEKRNISH